MSVLSKISSIFPDNLVNRLIINASVFEFFSLFFSFPLHIAFSNGFCTYYE